MILTINATTVKLKNAPPFTNSNPKILTWTVYNYRFLYLNKDFNIFRSDYKPEIRKNIALLVQNLKPYCVLSVENF